MRRNIALMLQLEGYSVVSAENGRIGLEMARKEKPDLILYDVMMPELDGYGVVQALREDADFSATPFIFLTARSDRSDVRIGMNFGADDYLTKPVVRDDLLAAVQVRLSKASAVQERIAEAEASSSGFDPDFSSPEPLVKALGNYPTGGGSAALGLAGEEQWRCGRHPRHERKDGETAHEQPLCQAGAGKPQRRRHARSGNPQPVTFPRAGVLHHQRAPLKAGTGLAAVGGMLSGKFLGIDQITVSHGAHAGA